MFSLAQYRLRPILNFNHHYFQTGHRPFLSLRSKSTSSSVHSVHSVYKTRKPRTATRSFESTRADRSPRLLIKPLISIPTAMPPSRTTNAAQAAILDTISITFLGTASAQPSSTRNHSSLALSLGGRGDIWLFDCGEATQQRIQKSNLKMGKIRKIFITHTHGLFLFTHI